MKEKKRERERKERKGGKEKRERMRRKGERKEKMKAVFRQSKLVRPRSKVQIFDEGCAPRCKDSSYLGIFLSFELLFWSTFGTTLCHVIDIEICSQY